MSERKWTPGPWPIDKTGDGKRIIVGVGLVDGPCGYDLAEIYADDCDPVEAHANAHLIAAAPDLYEALEELCLAAGGMPMTGIEFERRRQAGISALAKARGEA
jgi:hypothetical protein